LTLDDESLEFLKWKALIDKTVVMLCRNNHLIKKGIADVQAEAYLAYVRAKKNFNPDKRAKFSTYLHRCIQTTIISMIVYDLRKKRSHISCEFSEKHHSSLSEEKSLTEMYSIEEYYDLLSEPQVKYLEAYIRTGKLSVVGRMYGVSKQAVENAIRRALTVIRKAIEDEIA